MTQDTEPTAAANGSAAETTPVDEQSVYAKAAEGGATGQTPGEAIEADLVVTNPTREQVRALVDVLSADVRRQVEKAKKSIKPADAQLLARVGERAIKFTIALRAMGAEPSEKDLAKLEKQKLQIDSQLKAIKSIGSSIAAKQFWKLVDGAIDRVLTFALNTAIVAV